MSLQLHDERRNSSTARHLAAGPDTELGRRLIAGALGLPADLVVDEPATISIATSAEAAHNAPAMQGGGGSGEPSTWDALFFAWLAL